MTSDSINEFCLFGSCFFHLALYLWGLYMLLHLEADCSFLVLYIILLYDNNGIINNHRSFIHFIVNEHSGCFQFGVYYRVTLSCLIGTFWYTFDIGIFLGNDLLGHRVLICLNLVDIAKCPKLSYYIHSIWFLEKSFRVKNFSITTKTTNFRVTQTKFSLPLTSYVTDV